MSTEIVVPEPRVRGIRTTVVIAIVIASLGIEFGIGRITAPTPNEKPPNNPPQFNTSQDEPQQQPGGGPGFGGGAGGD
jgi:hypothetical protein